MIKLIVCHSYDRGIGYKGDLLFKHLKDDMDNFKTLTSGNVVVMGRKTWDSLPFKLPNRINIVITNNGTIESLTKSNNKDNQSPDYIADSVNDAISVATSIWYGRPNLEKDIFIIGGGAIYDYCCRNLWLIDEMIITKVYAFKEANTYFPDISNSGFATSRHMIYAKSERNEAHFSITTLVNTKHV